MNRRSSPPSARRRSSNPMVPFRDFDVEEQAHTALHLRGYSPEHSSIDELDSPTSTTSTHIPFYVHNRSVSDEDAHRLLLNEKVVNPYNAGWTRVVSLPLRLARGVLRRGVRIRGFVVLALLLALVIDFGAYMRGAGGYKEINTLVKGVASNHVNLSEKERVALRQRHGKVYIAALSWNNGGIMKKNWNDALLALIEVLGPENVFVSLYESGSWDDTKDVIRVLDVRLGDMGVARRIVMEDETHTSMIAKGPSAPVSTDDNETNWITTPQGTLEPRRIPYLAQIRNKVLEPLQDPHYTSTTSYAMNSTRKVLWLNDVVFTPADILTLLDTNDGSYSAACGLDFHLPPAFYDTFVMRDEMGHGLNGIQFPYFHFSYARRAMLSGHKSVRVKSCWNGAVAFDATPFIGSSGIKFRAVSDSLAQSHVEASECCLVHVDNELTSTLGVYVNPSVRVAYDAEHYAQIHSAPSWPTKKELLFGFPIDFYMRGLSTIRSSWRRDKMRRRVDSWVGEAKTKGIGNKETREKRRREDGTMCLIDEMQVLAGNGWKHV